jgi:holo-[acyl-carrier protein] synthase
MIFSIGTDILRADRVARVYDRFGVQFARRLLLPEEYALFARTQHPVRFLAMRFAAKEAIVKAMGTGFANGMWIRDCGTVPDSLGRPEVIFSARGRNKCRELGIGAGFLTLTDEAGLVVAVAVLERSTANAHG